MSKWKLHPDINYFFCTSTIVDWYPVFTNADYFNILIESLEYCRHKKGLRLHGYVIMLNHIHLIASSEVPSATLSDILRDFKRYTSHKISTALQKNGRNHSLSLFREAASAKQDQHYKIWQDGFHPIGIETEYFFKEKLDYIHFNPVKKGYVLEPEHWKYSSARNYAGLKPVPLTINCLY